MKTVREVVRDSTRHSARDSTRDSTTRLQGLESPRVRLRGGWRARPLRQLEMFSLDLLAAGRGDPLSAESVRNRCVSGSVNEVGARSASPLMRSEGIPTISPTPPSPGASTSFAADCSTGASLAGASLAGAVEFGAVEFGAGEDGAGEDGDLDPATVEAGEAVALHATPAVLTGVAVELESEDGVGSSRLDPWFWVSLSAFLALAWFGV